MGQCYSVSLRVGWTADEANIKRASDALRKKIEDDELCKNASYSLDKWKELGVEPQNYLDSSNSFHNLMRIFLAGWPVNYFDFREVRDRTGKWWVYDSDFDARYGWETILWEMFEVIAPFVDEGSYIEVAPDSGSWRLEAINGKAVEVSV